MLVPYAQACAIRESVTYVDSSTEPLAKRRKDLETFLQLERMRILAKEGS